jgi:5,10-methylenetetrahydrofolate reductase
LIHNEYLWGNLSVRPHRPRRPFHSQPARGNHDDLASIRALGLDVVTDLCDCLLAGGAPGLHFYTMNQAEPCTTIWQRQGLTE